MNISELANHAASMGCKIIDQTKFSMTADCGETFLEKSPESRLKIVVNTGKMDAITRFIDPPKNITPRSITIGKFSKQGTTSRLIQLGNLDEVEYVFGENEINSIANSNPDIKNAMNRIDRANKFTFMSGHSGIDPANIIRKEIDIISNAIVNKLEEHVAEKTGNSVICGSKVPIHKSWNVADNEKYRFLVKVNCKVPSILEPVTQKIDSIGSWNTMSESDRFYVKSIMPPGKDVFLTGIKLKSTHGTNQIEFEVVDDKVIKKKNFLENIKSVANIPPEKNTPINVKNFISNLTAGTLSDEFIDKV